MRAPLCLFAFSVCLYAQSAPTTPPAPPANCAAPAFHQLDFLIGEWEVREANKLIATNRWRPAVNGCVLIEDWVTLKGEPANSMFFHDPASKKWTWLGVATGGILESEGADLAFAGSGFEWKFKPDTKDRFTIEERNVKTGKQRTIVFTRGVFKPEAMKLRCVAPEHRQFDFWVGEWQVYVNGNHAGSNRIVPTPSNCVNVENWMSRTLSTGLSFNFYDRAMKKWRQVWVAPGSVLRLAGTFDGPVLRFEGQRGTTHTKLSFTPNPDGTVRQLWEQSTDSGATWSVAFDGHYRHVPPPAKSALIAKLQEAEKRTHSLIDSLTEEQAAFRPNEKAWSTHDIIDHLTTYERQMNAQLAKMIANPSAPSPSAFATPIIDAHLERRILDRSSRATAPEPIQPKQKHVPWKDLRAEFFAARAETIRLIDSASVDLRSIRNVYLFGATNFDAHQWALVMALHNLRHDEQIEETRRADLGILRRLAGRWSGTGRYIRPNAKVTAAWEPQLNGRFVRLDLRAADANGEFFAGQAMYQILPDGKYRAQWFDTSGNQYVVNAVLEGDALVADWGRGRSTYRLLPSGDLEEIDEFKTAAGGYQEFSRVRLARISQ